MNRKDFMQLISAGFSDPKLLSKATADFYTRCKQRLLSKMDVIAKAIESEEIPTGDSQYLSIQVPSGSDMTGCFIDVNELSIKAINAIQANGNASDYSDIQVEIYDYYSDTNVNVKIGDVFSQLGEASDSLTIAIEAFSALSSEVMSTASDFTNRIGILIPNMTEQTMQVCNDVYQLISASESNTSYLYELVNDYFGIKQNMTRTENDPFKLGDPAIEQYTGVNPTVSLLSGLDWLGPVKWWVAIRKFQVDAIVGIGKWIWKGLASVGKWFVKSVDTTFVNPVDVETSGDTYEFFSNYSSILYYLNNTWDKGNLPGPVLMKNLDKFFLDDTGNPRPIWFNLKTITYQVTFQAFPDSEFGPDTKILAFNRYIKPTNIHKFAEVLTAAGFSMDDSSGWGDVDWIKFARELQNTDLSCSKNASEREIAASLVLTNLIDRWLTKIFDITTPYHAWDDRNGVNKSRCAQLMADYMNEEIINQYMPGDIIRWIAKYNGLSVGTVAYGRQGIWYNDYDTEFNDNQSAITTFGPQTQIMEHILNDQVTNKDMLQLVCNFAVRSSGTNVHAQIASPFNGRGWNVAAPENIMNVGCNGTELGLSLLLAHMFLSEDIELVINYNSSSYEEYFLPKFYELYDGVYLAYSRGGLNINQNSNVKTDQQNSEAARNWMITAIVIVAAIAAAIYIGVSVTSLLKTVRLRQAQIDSNMFKLGEMISSGANDDEIDALYSSTSKLMKKNKLLGKLFGTTGYSLNAILGQTVSNINLPSTQVNTNLDPVLKLIRD